MAKRKTPSQNVPDAVREAVERTLQATIGSTRGRAQDAVDEVVLRAQEAVDRAQVAVDEMRRSAGAGAGVVRERLRSALPEERLPATGEDLRDVRAELRAIARRLDAIEQRLEALGEQPGGGRGGRAS